MFWYVTVKIPQSSSMLIYCITFVITLHRPTYQMFTNSIQFNNNHHYKTKAYFQKKNWFTWSLKPYKIRYWYCYLASVSSLMKTDNIESESASCVLYITITWTNFVMFFARSLVSHINGRKIYHYDHYYFSFTI